MTTALLREAAQTLRERAEEARVHPDLCPWRVSWDDATQVWDSRGQLVASTEGRDEAAHIALMDPPVALAVADLLDGWADDIAQHGGHHRSDDRALAVARAVLRRES